MKVGVYFSNPNKITRDQYDEILRRLRAAGAQNPAGREYHTAFGPPDHLMVFDIWTSREHFDNFGQTLAPIMQALQLDPGAPDVMDVHNVIVQPAPKPKAAAKKPAAKKQAAPKKKKSAARRKAKR